MGSSSIHDYDNLPILVAGGGAAGMKGNQHIRYTDPEALANLHPTLLDRVGVHLDSFGDNNGKIKNLFEPVDL
jgi:hypothetical protein